MRIAFDAKRYFHNATGLGRYSRELLDGLGRYHPEHEYLLCEAGRAEAPLAEGNVRVVSPGFDNRLLAAYWRSVGVARDAKRYGANVFHGLSNELPFGLRRNGIRSAVSVHDMIFLRYPNMYKRADRWIYERKVEYAVTHADAVIATSHQTADDLAFFYPVRSNRIVVVYQSVSLPQPRPDAERAAVERHGLPERFFLYVGRVEERKNLLGILDALGKSKDRTRCLAVVGKSHEPYLKTCKAFIAARGLAERVRFYTDVTRDELAVFYKRSLALLYPSYFEGFGIPIAEAQLSGTAVITSAGGCFAETAGEAAVFVNPAEPDSIAEAMDKIEFDDALRNRLVRLGHQNAARFTSERFAGSVMDVYKQLT